MALIYASLLETNAGPKRAQTSNTDNASRHVIYKMISKRKGTINVGGYNKRANE